MVTKLLNRGLVSSLDLYRKNRRCRDSSRRYIVDCEVLSLTAFALSRGIGRRRSARRKARKVRSGGEGDLVRLQLQSRWGLLLMRLRFEFDIPVFVRTGLDAENRGIPGPYVKSFVRKLYPHCWKHKPSKITRALMIIQGKIISMVTVNNRPLTIV